MTYGGEENTRKVILKPKCQHLQLFLNKVTSRKTEFPAQGTSNLYNIYIYIYTYIPSKFTSEVQRPPEK
jgi:hypothetical protein